MRTAVVLLALLGVAAGASTVQQFINDNNVINYALTLENFEAALYAAGAGFTDAQYTAAGYPAGTKAAIDYIGTIEAGHAVLLNNTLAARGWPAVPACNGAYNFGFTTVQQFVNLLGVVENAGTAAYDGAATAITDKNLLTLAAGVATIEARHTAILYTIINGGFNGSFTPNLGANAQTQATTFDQTIAVVAPFFTASGGGFINCPSATLNTAYNGTVTVSSTTFSSYRWVTANSLRGLTNDLTGYYGAVNSTIANNDLSILQYALALENFEATFYANYSSLYSVASIQASYPSISTANATLISQNFALIGQHEALHAAFLTGVLSFFGQTPGTPCNYTVPLTNTSTFTQFAQLAATIENVGVSAYVGAISFIANSQLSTAAAAIATVEGNHAAYVANLVTANGINFSPLPNTAGVAQGAADAPSAPSAVLTTVGPFIAQCTAQQLGTPAPISGTAFVNFFADQDKPLAQPFNTSSTTAATTTSSTSGARSTSSTQTRPTGSASGLFACAVLVIAAICAAL